MFSKKWIFALIIFGLIVIILLIGVNLHSNQASEFEYRFDDDNCLILTKYCGSDKKVTVPAKINGYNVKATENTFKDNNRIEKIVFKNGIICIGDNTCYNCTNLKEIHIPISVQSLGDYAFSNTALSALYLPPKMSYIGTGCFSNCSSLKIVKSKTDILYAMPLAFNNTDVEILQSHNLHYYDDTFTKLPKLSPNAATTFSMLHEPLYTIFQTTSQFHFFIQGLVLEILLIIFAVGIMISKYFVRKILISLGKDKLTCYDKWNCHLKNYINYSDAESMLVLKKPIFMCDKIKKVVTFLIVIIALVESWIWFAFFAMNKVMRDLNIDLFFGVLLRMLLLICITAIYVLIFVLLIIFIIIIAHLISNRYLLKSNRGIKTRIRKIGKENDYDK